MFHLDLLIWSSASPDADDAELDLGRSAPTASDHANFAVAASTISSPETTASSGSATKPCVLKKYPVVCKRKGIFTKSPYRAT